MPKAKTSPRNPGEATKGTYLKRRMAFDTIAEIRGKLDALLDLRILDMPGRIEVGRINDALLLLKNKAHNNPEVFFV